MKLTVISGATRPQNISNTAQIVKAFTEGFCEKGGETEEFYLSDRQQWSKAASAIENGEFILIAFPLYVENLPGILLEFLSSLTPRENPVPMAFIVQGGFDEASQLRCCEAYLKSLPQKLGCSYAGTLLKGGNFGIRFLEGKQKETLLAPWREAGKTFYEERSFETESAKAFSGKEFLTKKEIISFNLLGKPIMRIVFQKISKKLGRKKSLMARPYK